VNERERDHTQAPTWFLFPEVGRVVFSRVVEGEDTVATIWFAVDPTRHPRAGICVRPGSDLDGEIQGRLGSYLLQVNGNDDDDWWPEAIVANLGSIFNGEAEPWSVSSQAETAAGIAALHRFLGRVIA
jgi:hypothetical protein